MKEKSLDGSVLLPCRGSGLALLICFIMTFPLSVPELPWHTRTTQ